MRILSGLLLLLYAAVSAPAVTLKFSTADPTIGPFPSDAFTVADAQQKTGRRVSLPAPVCAAVVVISNDCIETAQLNQLDGFHVMPRVRLTFSAPIDPGSLRRGVWFVALDNLTNDEYGINDTGQFIPINEVIYDPLTNTAYFKPDIIIDQHRRFGVIVTDAVRDAGGAAIQADAAFTDCASRRNVAPGDYCGGVAQMVAEQEPRFGGPRIVGASIFTTMSATATLESLRQVVQGIPLNMKPAGTHSVFSSADLTGATLKLQEKVNSTATSDTDLPVQLLGEMRIAFGTFDSPSFMNEQLQMPNTPTNAIAPNPASVSTLAFHVYVPSSAAPATGYPVIIFGHGYGDTSFGGPSAAATVLTQQGFVVASINAFGHGSGPNSRLALTERSGAKTEILLGGRSLDIDRDGNINPAEGCVLPTLAGARDCLRQTVVDLMQFTRLLRSGPLNFGEGFTVPLNANRVYYVGQSLGAIYGTIFTAVEPNARAAVLNVGGGSMVQIGRLSPVYRPIARVTLASRLPSLLNAPVCGPNPTCVPNDFNDDYVARWQPAKSVTFPGAIAIQNYFENAEWYQMPGDPTAYAPHLKQSTLPGLPIKPVLFQIARGDMSMPNPASSTLIRNAWGREQTVLYRHDIARTAVPGLPDNPHTFLVNVFTTPTLIIAAAAQAQAAGFLASDGNSVPDVNPVLRRIFGVDVFERPEMLPEDLGFTP